jgi:TetR/AcrR family transcriptional regulator of autoinduction and epiphytic fitness
MKKRIDGRTAKGLRISRQIRERILTAYIDLIGGGVPVPTARETAKRAGLSLRVIFKHFSDLRALRLEAFNRTLGESRKFVPREVPDRGMPADRLEQFVRLHTRRLEYVTALRRTAAMVESIDPDVAQALREARNGAARDLARSLGSALKPFSRGEKRTLLTALHMACSWESWQFLRAHYRLSPRRARTIMARAALAILADAERRVHAPQGARA